MIDYIENKKENLLEVTIYGKLKGDEFKSISEQMQPTLDSWEEINIIEVIKDYEGVEFSALMQDLKFGIKNLSKLKKFNRCAVVADQKWIKNISNLLDGVTDAKVKSFDTTELNDARQWVKLA